jgi:hypothetical protein
MRKRSVLAAFVAGLALLGSPGAAVAATSGRVDFTTVKVGINPGTVVARGLINAAGVETNNRHLLPPGTPFQVVDSFPLGDILITATPTGAPQIVSFNPTTCVTTMILRTSVLVTGGTGAYAGASGTGAGVANRTVVSGRSANGTCLPLSQPSVFELSNVQSYANLTLP